MILFTWYRARSFPLAGRTDGGKRKEPHDGKKSSYTDTTETHAGFCVHAALGRLRFVSGSTAQLLYLVVFSISGTYVRVKIQIEKSVRVCAKFSAKQAQDWDLREQLYRIRDNIGKHIRCGHTPEKWRSGRQYGTPFFYFGSLPNPPNGEEETPYENHQYPY